MTQKNRLPEEVPETITFRTADRMMYGALGYDGNELMAVISGYDLEIKFNMRLINSLADAEACANALADVFYEALMDQLIRENKPFAKPPEAKHLLLNKRERICRNRPTIYRITQRRRS